MNLKSCLTGGPEVQKARQIVKELGSQPSNRISFSNSCDLDFAKGVLRKRMAKILGVFLALGIGAGGVVYKLGEDTNPSDNIADTVVKKVDSPSHSDVKKPTFNQADAETQTDDLIKRVEGGFQDFETLLRPAIEGLGNGRIRDELLAPFEVVKLNSGNSGKNAPRYHAEMSRRGEDMVMSENPYFFGYQSVSNMRDGIVAGFDPVSRIMKLSSELDTKNLLDMLILYHELRHSS